MSKSPKHAASPRMPRTPTLPRPDLLRKQLDDDRWAKHLTYPQLAAQCDVSRQAIFYLFSTKPAHKAMWGWALLRKVARVLGHPIERYVRYPPHVKKAIEKLGVDPRVIGVSR